MWVTGEAEAEAEAQVGTIGYMLALDGVEHG